ncbi:HtaA domain-containing protein [Streptomyces sp. NPDC020681]|uniref:HtaA domain-containing protein n=1 Tax=Streptomyces sp. NPDC020681 TaxID=3365083 RepID=UPI00379F263F
MSATRRPITRAAAVATAAALGATAFALPAIAAGNAPAAPGAPKIELKDGTLEWGFKESFRKYVTGMAMGTIVAADGAKQAAGNGPFTFTDGTGTYDTGTHATDTAFKGSVLFSSKAHGFDIKLADVKVVTEGKGGSIQADVTLNGTTQDDIAVAKLDLTSVPPGQGEGGAMVFKNIPATLTADGAKAFNGMYKEGDALDAATLSVKPAGGPSSPSPTPSATATATPTPTASATPTPTPTVSATETPAAEEGAIVDGNLDWGVKKSFRDYVTGPMAHGKAELTDGATKSGEGYRFPKAKGSYDAEKKSLVASFDGGVRFLGHLTNGQYVLDLSLTGLEVEVNGTTGTLVADVTTKDRETQKVSTYKNLGIASLTVPAGGLEADGDVVRLTSVPAKLTADGTKAFGGMYRAGEALDALTVAVSLTEDAELPSPSPSSGSTAGTSAGGSTGGSSTTGGGGTVGGGTGGSLATTGAGVPAAELATASALVAVTGAAVVVAVRRRESARA